MVDSWLNYNNSNVKRLICTDNLYAIDIMNNLQLFVLFIVALKLSLASSRFIKLKIDIKDQVSVQSEFVEDNKTELSKPNIVKNRILAKFLKKNKTSKQDL